MEVVQVLSDRAFRCVVIFAFPLLQAKKKAERAARRAADAAAESEPDAAAAAADAAVADPVAAAAAAPAADASSSLIPARPAARLLVRDGQLVVDDSSLLVHVPVEAAGQRTVVEEGGSFFVNTGQRVTSASFGKTPRAASLTWSVADTDLFYTALAQCGTDFSLVAQFFPDRTRVHIKHKFHKEERTAPERMAAALRGDARRAMDAATFQPLLAESARRAAAAAAPASAAGDVAGQVAAAAAAASP